MGFRTAAAQALTKKVVERHDIIAAKRKDRKESKNQMTKVTRWMNAVASIKTPSSVNVVRYDESSSVFDAINEATTEVQSRTGFPYLKAGIGQQKQLLKGGNYDEVMANPHNRTSLFYGQSPNNVKLLFKDLIDVRILDSELDWAEKYGPYFKLDYVEWAKKVNALFTDIEGTDFSAANVLALHKHAHDIAKELIADGEVLTPLSFEDGLKAVKKGKNAGAPFFTKNWSKPENTDMLDFYVAKAQAIFNGEDDFNLPAVLFTRNTPNNSSPKMRPVECPEGSMKWLDIMFQVPVTKLFQKTKETFGYNGVQEMAPLFEYCFDNGEHFYSLDFSAFDASVRQDMMDCIFDTMFPIMFALSDEHKALLTKIKAYYLTCDLMTPSGLYQMVDDRVHGLFSGMGLTSVIGTLSNLIAIRFAMTEAGYDSESYLHFAFGDDTVIASTQEVDLRKISATLALIGFKMNVEKTHVSSLVAEYPRIDFLGCSFLKGDCRPIRSLMRSLPGLVFQKNDSDFTESLPDLLRYDDNDKVAKDKARAKVSFMGTLSKLANLYAHQHFQEICRIVVRYSPDHWFDDDDGVGIVSTEEMEALMSSDVMEHPIQEDSHIARVMRDLRKMYEF